MKKLVEKTRKANWGVALLKAVLICQMAFVFLAAPMEVHATDEISFTSETGGELGQMKIVTGTVDMFNDATTVLLILEAAGVGALCLVKFMGMQQSDDNEKPKYKKEIKSIIITGIIAVCITGILKAVFSYYQ